MLINNVVKDYFEQELKIKNQLLDPIETEMSNTLENMEIGHLFKRRFTNKIEFIVDVEDNADHKIFIVVIGYADVENQKIHYQVVERFIPENEKEYYDELLGMGSNLRIIIWNLWWRDYL